MRRKIKDIYYIAGILEGEGCFLTNGSPTIKLSMTDRDIVMRVRNLMGANKIIHAFKSSLKNGWKQKYTLTLHGSLAIQWMMTLYPLMGERRRTKIKEVIEVWKTMRNKQKVEVA